MDQRRIGYIRVNTNDENADDQLKGVELVKVFTDTCSDSDTERPALKELIEYCTEGDEVHIQDKSRLSNNDMEMNVIVRELNQKGIDVYFHKEDLLFIGGF